MTQEVLALCGAMGAAEGREELLIPLIQVVLRELALRLKEGTAPEDCGPAFPLAAAMVAMDRLSELDGGGSAGEVASFTAGDLTVRRAAGGQGAKSLSRRAEGLLAPWLRDGGGFVFQGVKG